MQLPKADYLEDLLLRSNTILRIWQALSVIIVGRLESSKSHIIFWVDVRTLGTKLLRYLDPR